jgi:transcriptional regulator with XRE-family HTH domain
LIIAERLKALREQKNMSQADIEKRTGLLRCYTSQVENGRITPSLKTVEKYARAFEIPLYRIFCDKEARKKPILLKAELDFERTEEGLTQVKAFAAAWSRLNERDRRLLVVIAKILVRRS